MHYEMRMPLYEIQHLKQPSRDLLPQITFSAGDQDGRLIASNCRRLDLENAFFCEADYEFAAPPVVVSPPPPPVVTLRDRINFIRRELDIIEEELP